MGIYAISGAGSGIGAATRARLEAAGHEVVGVDLRNAEITDLKTLVAGYWLAERRARSSRED